ncbi:MAG TPA: DNA cytosine methyltransferase [Prolixibacteraceae bacterium]|nr:DNA cytosine methyltransferase [Prolixibacteraceae bacterium]
MTQIPIIDLFAGPGGLGEGFSSIINENGQRTFQIKLSIEKDEFAHKTLELRSFFRQFPIGQVPEDYYEYIRNYKPSEDKINRETLFNKFSKEAQRAKEEVWQCTLGDDNFSSKLVDDRIKNALKNTKDWLLIGGPPCQAYSLVGRSRNRGISEDDPRVFLYREYLRIIAVHHPAIFVMENVKGLLSAKYDGDSIFDWIKADLKNPGKLFPNYNSPKYRIYSLVQPPKGFDTEGNPIYSKDQDFLIRTELYGIPQKRHRVILLGIREDFGDICFDPIGKKNEVKLRDVINELPKLRSGIGRELALSDCDGKQKYRKINDSQTNWVNTVNEYLELIKKEFPEVEIDLKNILKLTKGKNFQEVALSEESNPLKNWYHDEKIGGVLNHETRTHLKEDLSRYLFSSIYLKIKGDFPKLRDYPDWLLPNHKNARGTKFADRFRTQRTEEPATTITSHISKDGHYFIHYDPEQCRSLTVREAARIQTFPDNYFFCGARTAQYHQVGNAVPPYLASQIGEIVSYILNSNNLKDNVKS